LLIAELERKGKKKKEGLAQLRKKRGKRKREKESILCSACFSTTIDLYRDRKREKKSYREGGKHATSRHRPKKGKKGSEDHTALEGKGGRRGESPYLPSSL